MKIQWWKWLGVILLGYAILVGLTVKTGPGIANVSPDKVVITQPFNLHITGYNTTFNKADNSVWLKIDSNFICSDSVVVDDDEEIRAFFSGDIAPQYLAKDTNQALVIVENTIDGMMLDVDAVTTIEGKRYITLDCMSRPEKLKSVAFTFPYRRILYETIRNLNYHVPMWFSMITLLLIAFVASIMALNKNDLKYDRRAYSYTSVALLFGLMGISTGAFWAKFTWGVFWTADPKLNGAAVGILMYLGYMILRSAIEDEDKRARVSAVYNILAFPMFIVLIIVLPKMADFSLHPGSGDSVGFNQYDLNNNLRKVFYPAVIGWILIGAWIADLTKRYLKIKDEKNWE